MTNEKYFKGNKKFNKYEVIVRKKIPYIKSLFLNLRFDFFFLKNKYLNCWEYEIITNAENGIKNNEKSIIIDINLGYNFRYNLVLKKLKLHKTSKKSH